MRSSTWRCPHDRAGREGWLVAMVRRCKGSLLQSRLWSIVYDHRFISTRCHSRRRYV